MSFEMIAVDLDSTLLKADKTVSDYTKEVLQCYQKRGTIITFVTARLYSACTRFINILNPDVVISNYGALIQIDDKVLHKDIINVDIANKLVEKLMQLKNLGYLCAETENNYFANMSADLSNLTMSEFFFMSHTDISQGLNGDALTIAAEIFDDTTAYQIVSEFPSVSVIPFSGGNFFGFAESSVDKWRAVKILADHMNINTSQIVAFGDDYSDIKMLKNCGVGVAVANAIDECKNVADFVCDTNDNDGVAKWLKKNI